MIDNVQHWTAEGGPRSPSEADRLAKEAVLLHESHPSDVRTFRSRKASLINVAMHMLETLDSIRLERSSQAKFPRLETGTSLAMPKVYGHHNYVWNGSFWFCNICYLRTSSPQSLSSSRRNCIGSSPFDRFKSDSKGHCLFFAFCEGSTIVYCSRCWCFSCAVSRNLSRECRSSSAANYSSNKFYLSRGKHPVSKLKFSKPFYFSSLFLF